MALDAVSKILHCWSSRYGVMATVGGKPVHTRNSAGAWADQQGIKQSAIVNTPRLGWATLASERRPVLRLEYAATNLVLQSENFGTTWAALGTPTRVAAAHIASGVSLDLIGDDDAAVAEGYQQTITFTADAVKSASVVVKKGSSTSSVIRVQNSVTTANVLYAVVTWSGTTPSVAMTNGSYLYAEAMADGAYRLFFRTTSVTAANNHTFEVYPASDAALAVAPTGTLYVGGCQAENSLAPSSYVATTTATVTRSADLFYWDFAPVPQNCFIYLRFIERGSTLLGTAVGAFDITSVGGATPYAAFYVAAGKYRLEHHNGTSNVNSTAGVAPAVGDVVELVGSLQSTGVKIVQSINGAAVGAGAASGALAFAAAWAAPAIRLNDAGSSIVGLNDFAEVKIVNAADMVASTDQGWMDELRAFEMNAGGEVINNGSS